MRVKIAIGAFGLTEGPVDINPKAAIFPIVTLVQKGSPISQMRQRGD